MKPRPNVIKLFMSVIYKYLTKVSILGLGRPFWHTIMFASKVRAYLDDAPFKCSTLVLAPVALPTNIRLE
jgi:hypothetical protein